MSDRVTTPDGLVVVEPGGGDAFPSLDVVRKTMAVDSGGWGVVLVTGYPGEGGRTHIHDGEAETFYILEGPVDLLGRESVTPPRDRRVRAHPARDRARPADGRRRRLALAGDMAPGP